MNPTVELFPEIISILPIKLIGLKITTSLSENKTFMLWNSFMKRRHEIENKTNDNFYSIQVYHPTLNFNDFTPQTRFDKLATVSVSDYLNVPESMERYALDGGLYAKFLFIGNSNHTELFFNTVFNHWFPDSNYEVDNTRPHFEILGEKYNRNSEFSEEDIFIPIKNKR